MKYHVIDNSLTNLGKTVLWQYDRAVRLLSVMKHMQVLYHCAVEQFWDFWTTKVLSIDTCGALGCSIWGMFLGVPRPTVVENDKERPIANAVYRRILKGAFYLMKANCSYEDILGYIEILFGIGGEDSLSKWKLSEGLAYGWSTNIDELNGAYVPGVAYSHGDVVWHQILDETGKPIYDGNWKFIEGNYKIVASWEGDGERPANVIVNSSWEAVSPYLVQTQEKLPPQETLLLKLYDPEGICRKIGGAPANALSISVSCEFGETTITAQVTRRRKCGVTLTDNGDMSMDYGKSQYFDEMHKDQKYIYEQRLDEFCPFPLGVKTNAPVPEWVFGFKGQVDEASQYKVNFAYSKDAVFGYADPDGKCYNYKCKQDITARENTSFNAIKAKVEITSGGDPFVGGLVETKTPIQNMSLNYQFIPVGRYLAFNGYRQRWKFAHFALLFGVDEYFYTILREMAGLSISSAWDYDESLVMTPIAYVIEENKLYYAKMHGLRYIVVASKPTEAYHYFEKENVLVRREEAGWSLGYSHKTIFTSSAILTSPYNDALLAVQLAGENGQFLENARLRAQQAEIERCIGLIAERYGWKIIGAADAQTPQPEISYDKNTTFRIKGQYVYFDGKGNYPLLAKTTLVCDSTQRKLEQKGA